MGHTWEEASGLQGFGSELRASRDQDAGFRVPGFVCELRNVVV